MASTFLRPVPLTTTGPFSHRRRRCCLSITLPPTLNVRMLSIILCDRQPGLVSAWRSCFSGRPEVSIEQGDLLDVEADAYVSPANSFGFMDGGIDADLSARFPGVQYRVQSAIAGLGGLLPVGEVIIVETEDPFVPYLVSAPTMQV